MTKYRNLLVCPRCGRKRYVGNEYNHPNLCPKCFASENGFRDHTLEFKDCAKCGDQYHKSEFDTIYSYIDSNSDIVVKYLYSYCRKCKNESTRNNWANRKRKTIYDWLYFIQFSPKSPVKIGVSNRPRQRLTILQAGNPYKLYFLALIPGNKSLERKLHAKFTHYLLESEWYEWSEEIELEISTLITQSRHSLIHENFYHSDSEGVKFK